MKNKLFSIFIILCGLLLFFICIFYSSPYRELRPYAMFGAKLAHDKETKKINGNFVIHISGSDEINDFYIDQTPVTIGAYKRCTISGFCLTQHYDRYNYAKFYDNNIYNIFPMTFVSFTEAQTYCQAYGGDLPTAAQWELAAGKDEYAWGNQMPSISTANIDGYYQWQTPAGWLPKGISSFGVLDLNGNVREWMLDDNPENPSEKVLKGGGFQDSFSSAKNTYAFYHEPYSAGFNRGFRCVYEFHN